MLKESEELVYYIDTKYSPRAFHMQGVELHVIGLVRVLINPDVRL